MERQAFIPFLATDSLQRPYPCSLKQQASKTTSAELKQKKPLNLLVEGLASNPSFHTLAILLDSRFSQLEKDQIAIGEIDKGSLEKINRDILILTDRADQEDFPSADSLPSEPHYDPMEDTTRIEIKIKGKLSEFSLKLLQQFLKGIEGLLNIEDTEIRFVGAKKGSVILGLDLPTEQANYLNEVIELGRLEDLGILSATKLFRFRTLFEEDGPDPSVEYLPKKLQLFSSSTNLNLSYGKFAYLEAIQMDLSNSQLRYADLSRANLQNVNLENADLSYANLQDAQLLQIRLKGAKLEGMKANESQREALALAEADLSQVNFNSDFPLLQMPG